MMTLPSEIEIPALWLIPLLPLCGAFFVLLFSQTDRSRHYLAGWIATFFSLTSFLCVVNLWWLLHLAAGGRVSGSSEPSSEVFVSHAWQWIHTASFQVAWSLRLDRLSTVMSLVVTGIGTLIHLYAIGYMAEDKSRPRFFCYLNLFLFAMLLLVLGNNLLVMFVGWEGVGLCSYLLIGFWFSDMNNAHAGQKAFIVNRIGDAGFLLGMFTLLLLTGTIDFGGLEKNISSISPEVRDLAAFLLFIGAVGKSAQIPLYVWLPDAMAGPTPVSALIHAATMVTAGVYMIARLSFLYVGAPHTLFAISVIGTLTAFFAATVALVQNDIKKVLAYSTVSQLGYMFMALGAGAFSNGIYHVVTHAFFKACLFLAAGSVILGCHHEQDMRHFGGLRKKMPITFFTYFCATFAIAGFPFTSGFYSKDAILWTVYSNSNPLLVSYSHIFWAIGLFTAFLTAFYMTRSLMLTFFGEYRGHAHPHESPWVVWVPLVLLALPSLFFARFYGGELMEYLEAWTRPDLKGGHEALASNPTYHLLEMVSGGVAITGMLLAWLFYGPFRHVPGQLAKKWSFLYQLLLDKYRVDEAYAKFVVRPVAVLANFFFLGIDRVVVDGVVNGTGMFVEANGEMIRLAHTGRISFYALLMFISSVGITIFWLIL